MERFLGGEGSHRGFLGGTDPATNTRNWVMLGVMVSALVATPRFGVAPLMVGLVGAATVWVAMMPTHHGSRVDRWRQRSRWKARLRLGTHVFVPYDETVWESLLATKVAARDQAAMRAMPDGADGMGWLQSAKGVAGIAWHEPVGETPYLSVVFAVAGQIRGIESGEKLERLGEAWSMFLAGCAQPGSLVTGVQTLTRVMPPDTARHEAWAEENLDPDALDAAVASYAQVIERSSAGAMIQRHYVVATWDLSADFKDAAGRYGAGTDGWRALMEGEVDKVLGGLQLAGLGGGSARGVYPLTARGVAAVILHQQNPALAVDAVRGVDPLRLGIRSQDEFSAHVVDGTDYMGRDVQWWHRTAVIQAARMTTDPRSQLWVMPLLVGGQIQCHRSLSFHMRLVPAMHAKPRARKDLTLDASARTADASAGRLASDTTDAALSAAARRVADLSEGSAHHGVEWVGYITISAATRDELRVESRILAQVCAGDLGARLLWLDSYQSAASGTTWPIGRGIRSHTPTLSSRMTGLTAGQSVKESM